MKLLSFGEMIWDVYPDVRVLGGAPLNFAAHTAAMGAEAYIMSAVGDDSLGREALVLAKAFGVDMKYVSVQSEFPTGRCDVKIDSTGIPTYTLAENTAYDNIEYHNMDGEFDILAFGTLSLRCDHNREVVKKLISDNNFRYIYTDLNIRPPFYSKESIVLCLENADIVKISAEELPTVTEAIFSRPMTVKDGIAELSRRFDNIGIIVVTDGERGAYCYSADEDRTYFVKAEKVDVVSTVGAGDSFGAAFVTCLLSGDSIDSSLKTASRVSGLVVSHKEAVPPNTAEFIRRIKRDD